MPFTATFELLGTGLQNDVKRHFTQVVFINDHGTVVHFARSVHAASFRNISNESSQKLLIFITA